MPDQELSFKHTLEIKAKNIKPIVLWAIVTASAMISVATVAYIVHSIRAILK